MDKESCDEASSLANKERDIGVGEKETTLYMILWIQTRA